MASESPRVTVFIPTFNRAGLLRDSIASVLAQRYGPFRLVVADNASTDETPTVVSSFEDERVLHLRRPENLGLFGNFRACLEDPDSEFCVLLGDDDLLHPDFLARTVARLDEHPRAGMVHTAFSIIDDHGRVVEPHADWAFGPDTDTVESSEQFIAESMTWGCRVCSSAALIRTAALPPEPLEEADFPAFDFGLWLRMALEWETAFIARPLASYRVHATSQTAILADPDGAGYRAGREWVAKREEVKTRFLDTYEDRLDDVPALRRSVYRSRRNELLVFVRQATLPERRPLPTLRLLGRAVQADRRIAIDPAAWKLAVGSLLGPRVVQRVQGLRRT